MAGNEIRAELGVTTQSGTFQKLWGHEGIPHTPSRDIATGKRLATLKANRCSRATTKSARSPTGNASALPAGKHRCAACGYLGSPLDRHHVIYRRHLVAGGIEPALLHDPRNLVWLCTPCHQRQDSDAQPLALSMLPDAALQFAVGLLGADAAREYLTSHYGGDDTRLP